MGVSEVTDSITVVVSEETGQISLTKNGKLHRDLKTEQLKDMLLAEFSGNEKRLLRLYGIEEKASWIS